MFTKYKTIFIIIAVAAVLGLFAYGVISALKSSGSKPPAGSGKVIDIPTSRGKVQVKDFSQNLVKKIEDTSLIKDAPDYSIAYFEQEKTFNIVLQTKPLQKARDEAEQAFLDGLQISKGDACKLQVSLTVPFSVDSNLSGQNYGLSFCPNSVQFP